MDRRNDITDDASLRQLSEDLFRPLQWVSGLSNLKPGPSRHDLLL